MSRYLLSVHMSESTAPSEPPSPEDMAAGMERINALETDMKSKGAFVFSARLHGPESATVVHPGDGDLLLTDGPFVESKEHVGGFYIVEAADLDEALAWAGRVVECIGAPIEVWPFADTAGL